VPSSISFMCESFRRFTRAGVDALRRFADGCTGNLLREDVHPVRLAQLSKLVPRSQGPLPARPASVGWPVTAAQFTFALRPTHARERRAQHVRLGPALQDRGARPSLQPFRGGAQPVPPARSIILSAGLIPFPLPAPSSFARRRTLTRTRRQESSWARKRSRLHARRSSALDRARRCGSSQLVLNHDSTFVRCSQHEQSKPSSESRSARDVSLIRRCAWPPLGCGRPTEPTSPYADLRPSAEEATGALRSTDPPPTSSSSGADACRSYVRGSSARISTR
jgi:hypothetical protein